MAPHPPGQLTISDEALDKSSIKCLWVLCGPRMLLGGRGVQRIFSPAHVESLVPNHLDAFMTPIRPRIRENGPPTQAHEKK